VSAEAYRWQCSCCGEEFTGLPMALVFEAPVDWEALDEATRAASQLDSDFCEVRYSNGEVDRFIRCQLPLPVPRISDEFCFGVWMSVSERSWDIYEAGFDSGSYSENGCFGYLMHDIPEYAGSLLLHADIIFKPDGLRPHVFLHETDHPLFAAQRDGIDVTQIQRWAATTHDNE
jgi:hypothetical protein